MSLILNCELFVDTGQNERILALCLLRAVDCKLAEKIATAVLEGESEKSPIKVVAKQVVQEAATRGYSFSVVGSFKKFEDAVSFAEKLINKKVKYRPEVYIVPERKLLIFPISASVLNFNPQNTQCIPAVKICAFLELEKNF